MLLDEPLVENIHYWIVHNVERVGNVAQKFVYAPCHIIAATAAGTHPHDYREQEYNARNLVKAVDAGTARRCDVGHREYSHEQQAAQSECTFNFAWLVCACEQHTRGERE